jgi:hypothetical protein
MNPAYELTIKDTLDEAFDAARAATDAYLKENPNNWFPCGFSWVHIKATSPVVKVLKKHFPERCGHPSHPSGWDIWNPSGHNTQCMAAKEMGADAFARVLNAANFPCYADSRWD